MANRDPNEVREIIQLVVKHADRVGIDPKVLLSLVEIESSFGDSQREDSTAVGPLQITEIARKDLEQHGIPYDISTLEGRIAAGADYFKKVIKDRYQPHYGLTDEEAVAAYFAGIGTVVNKKKEKGFGIDDEIIENQISTREYVDRFQKAYTRIASIDAPSPSESELGYGEEYVYIGPPQVLAASIGPEESRRRQNLLNPPGSSMEAVEQPSFSTGDQAGDLVRSSPPDTPTDPAPQGMSPIEAKVRRDVLFNPPLPSDHKEEPDEKPVFGPPLPPTLLEEDQREVYGPPPPPIIEDNQWKGIVEDANSGFSLDPSVDSEEPERTGFLQSLRDTAVKLWDETKNLWSQNPGVFHDAIRVGITPTGAFLPSPDVQALTIYPERQQQFVMGVIEGVNFGQDLFDLEGEESQLEDWEIDLARVVGEFIRMYGETVATGGVAVAIRNAPWVVRALRANSRWFNRATQSAPLLQRLGSKTAPLVDATVVDAAHGALFSGVEQLLAPEERKPEEEGTLLNIGQFVFGGLGGRTALSALRRVRPNASPATQHLVGFLGDTVGSTLAILGITEDVDLVTSPEFMIETTVIGLFHVVSGSMIRGDIKPSPEIVSKYDLAMKTYEVYEQTGDIKAKHRALELLDEVIALGTPEGMMPQSFGKMIAENTEAEWASEIEIVRRRIKELEEVPPTRTLEPVEESLPRPGRPAPSLRPVEDPLPRPGRPAPSLRPVEEPPRRPGRPAPESLPLRPVEDPLPRPGRPDPETTRPETTSEQTPEQVSKPTPEPTPESPAETSPAPHRERPRSILYEESPLERIMQQVNERRVYSQSRREVVNVKFEREIDLALYDFGATIKRLKEQGNELMVPVVEGEFRRKYLIHDDVDVNTLAVEYHNQVIRDVDSAIRSAQKEEIVRQRTEEGGESPIRRTQRDDAEEFLARRVSDEAIVPVRSPLPTFDRQMTLPLDIPELPQSEPLLSAEFREKVSPRLQKPRWDSAKEREELRKRTEEIVKYVMNHSGEFSAEDLYRLRELNKPSEGFPINTTRFDANPDNLDTLNKIAELVKDPNVLSHQEVETKARQRISAKDATERFRKLGVLNEEVEYLINALRTAPEIVTSYEALVASHGARVQELKQRITDPTREPSDLELAEFYMAVENHVAMTTNLKDLQTNTARTLNAMKIRKGDNWVDLTDLTPYDIANSLDAQSRIQHIVETAGGRDAIKKIAEELDDSTLANLTNSSRDLVVNKPWRNYFLELRRSNLLSNPYRMVRDSVAQTLHIMLDHTKNFGAATVGLVARPIRRLRGVEDPVGMTFGEAMARFTGEMSGLLHSVTRPVLTFSDASGRIYSREGPSMLERLWMAVTRPNELLDLLNATSLTSRIAQEGQVKHYGHSSVLRDTRMGRLLSAPTDILGKPLEWGGRIFGADINKPLSNLMWRAFDYINALNRLAGYGTVSVVDRLFSQSGYVSSLSGELYRLKRQDPDLNVEELMKLTLDYRADIMVAEAGGPAELSRHLQELPEETLNQIKMLDDLAIKNARRMTFQDELETPITQAIQNVVRQSPEIQLVLLPFNHTPQRIFEASLELAPGLQFLHRRFRADLFGNNGPAAQERAVMSMVIGAAIVSYGAHLAAQGKLTGTFTNEERRGMTEAGLQENAIKFGDRWIRLTNLDPAPATFFRLAADGYYLIRRAQLEGDDETALQIASHMIMSVAKSITNDYWLSSLLDLISAYEHGGSWYLENFGDTMIPFTGLRRSLRSNTLFGWEHPLYYETQMEANSLAERIRPLRPALDSFGKEIPNRSNILGMPATTFSDSPIRLELARLGMSLPRVRNQIDGVTLDADEYHAYRRTFAEIGAEEMMNAVVKRLDATNASPQERREAIIRAWQNVTDMARREFIRKNPEIRLRILDARLQRIQDRRNSQYLFNFDSSSKGSSGTSLEDLFGN